MACRSRSGWLRPLLLALCLVTLLACLPAATGAKSGKHDKTYRKRDTECRATCGLTAKGTEAPEAVLNCHKRCVSESCYEAHYAKDPLEEGEIDDRLPMFRQCVLRELNKLNLRGAGNGAAADADSEADADDGAEDAADPVAL